MPQAVLAGADGRSPAIDQVTGTPLTMEMLLRRRGMITTDGGGSLMQQGTANGVGGSPVAAQSNTAPVPSGATGQTGAAPLAQSGAAPFSIPEQAAATQPAPVSPTVADASTDSMPGLEWLLPLLGMAAKRTMPNAEAPTTGGPRNIVAGPTPQDGGRAVAIPKSMGGNRGTGNFGADDIGTANGNKTQQALLARRATDGEYRVVGDDPQLGAPQRKLPQPTTQYGAAPAKQEQLGVTRALTARNNASAGVPMVPEPSAIAPAMGNGDEMDGVLRTLGMDPAMIEQLTKNPGLLDTLRRTRPR